MLTQYHNLCEPTIAQKMATDLTSLPLEIIGSILSYLSIQTLLSFGSTNKQNQTLAQYALTTLDLAILPRQVHCNLALASQYCRDEIQGDIDPPRFGIAKTTNIPISLTKECLNPTVVRKIQIEAQNQIASDILSKESVQNLQSLCLHTYEIQSEELTRIIGRKLPHLRNLELNFCHQFIHNLGTSANYWRTPSEGTPCWNSLVGLGLENQRQLRLRNLHSLKIERAGLTSAQLRKLIESNNGLRRLDLTNVTGVDLDFLNWLAERCRNGNSKIQHLHLENCSKLIMRNLEDFACLSGLADSAIQHVSLFDCAHVSEQRMEDLAVEGGGLSAFSTFVLPSGRKMHHGYLEKAVSRPSERPLQPFDWVHRAIDVDPDFAIQQIAVAA